MIGYNQYSDQELTNLLKAGDREAFNEIYFRYSSLLYHYALNILQQEDECTDALQDVFVWLWVNQKKLNITCLKAYLMAAVKYKLTRVILASKKRAELLSRTYALKEMAVEEDSIEIKELKAAINDFVNNLPQRAKEIYQMSREQYLSNKEIASRLGITEKTVENQMTINLKKLKLHLGKMSFWSTFL
ncbi:RNA polymerase sigma-70 factor [Niabella ginsenosidivorans]|uniref:RNA polymerase sigma-70 factor n=1 Tax=Niabella ginsenosidivorans TaxID=1176587 RepID=A0A1A9HZT0_9BACT|nr:sigma-70 family RNA polymerase sigma factor [Niabella ginsenosidivorans]ANH80585.1 RNA polymerase sigma-70 factor [Niabella ginsenosidivorans]